MQAGVQIQRGGGCPLQKNKSRYEPNWLETLIKELGFDNCSTPTGNSTYTSCQMSSKYIVNTHDTFMKSIGIELSDDDKRLPYLTELFFIRFYEEQLCLSDRVIVAFYKNISKNKR